MPSTAPRPAGRSGRGRRRGAPPGRPALLLAALCLLLAAPAPGQEVPPLPADPPAEAARPQPPAPPPPPPAEVRAADTPSDSGRSVTVRWSPPAEPAGAGGPLLGFRIERATGADGPFAAVGQAPPGAVRYDDTGVDNGVAYYYRVVATRLDAETASAVAGPAIPRPQWINTNQWNVFLILALLLGFNLYFIEHIKAGGKPFIRKIAGLEAVTEAVGRATEMGRPILFVPGIQDMNDIQTVAGVTILGYIARTTAEYDSRLTVPTSRALVMTTARETVKEAYLSAGRPDSYDESSIYYITDEQFGYVAGVNGYMVRERPATCFYMGAFYAESLILAETGNSIGAIQVAGTAQPAQLPFFVAACDYTLIGEELFAASAYLSGEPKQLGSIKGQDVGKLLGMVSIVIGVTVLSLALVTGWEPLRRAAEFVREFWSTELA
ncbi:MAG: fibronectin type III domain-containing protein [Candidatus Eisenbacteria bacterium]|uniref:Fibronectin type III domain-containing protein n=1 Tax=Eiseniibacteriota bacterium TaxID=2212470 RepID=A0A937XC16_UNCEI|nr:fibronectin type III domain-containing protein [Candidatus Eisenbacteria bacterium]